MIELAIDKMSLLLGHDSSDQFFSSGLHVELK